MDLAKDLAWQKIFGGRSTNLKIEKSGFFLHFRYGRMVEISCLTLLSSAYEYIFFNFGLVACILKH